MLRNLEVSEPKSRSNCLATWITSTKQQCKQVCPSENAEEDLKFPLILENEL
jgi:hypothetical protein